jgi:RNA polymerase sigma factor (sigma-70 family)
MNIFLMSKTHKTESVPTVVEALKRNDTKTLNRLYSNNYWKIESLVLKNNGTKAHAKDIFQEAFLAVWLNVKQGQFKPLNESSINAYLYTVAKNKWMDVLRSKGYRKTIVESRMSHFEIKDEEDQGINDKILKDKQLGHVMMAFKSLGEACRVLLRKFYFEKKSMKNIADDLQLDAASTRNKKYRCMQKLRQIALNNN